LWAETKRQRPVTLPVVLLQDDFDIEREAREAQERVAERRVIKNGVEAWEAIGKAESFEGWKRIGAALSVGKQFALRATGANAAWGRNYSRAFNGWLKQHRFDGMAKSVRSVAIELVENINAIERWRATLPERKRRQLIPNLELGDSRGILESPAK
jgi:hypothetical protein